jgi:hypothetical protein
MVKVWNASESQVDSGLPWITEEAVHKIAEEDMGMGEEGTLDYKETTADF